MHKVSFSRMLASAVIVMQLVFPLSPALAQEEVAVPVEPTESLVESDIQAGEEVVVSQDIVVSEESATAPTEEAVVVVEAPTVVETVPVVETNTVAVEETAPVVVDEVVVVESASPVVSAVEPVLVPPVVSPIEPELSTDQADYAPGSIATIFGKFFQSLTDIVLHIFGDSEPSGDYADDYATVTTDESGSFTYQYQLDPVFRPLYTVIASALDGTELAQTTFTDAPPINIGYKKGIYKNNKDLSIVSKNKILRFVSG